MIQHNRPWFGPEEASAVQRVIESGWVAQGPEVQAFEREFCEYLGLEEGHAVAVSSGSAALFLALWAAKGQGATVAVPALSCSSLRNAVALVGAKPLFVDCVQGGANVDLDVARSYKPAVSIFAHMFGIPTVFRPQVGETIIEDCAQSLGAETGGIKAGLQGKLGVFSFAATKLMTAAGQGGMVVSRDRGLVDAIRDYREFDCRRDSHARFNFTLTDVQAAVGRVQLAKFERGVERRRAIFARYLSTGRRFLGPQPGQQTKPIPYRAVLLTDSPEAWIRKLAEAQIKAIVPVEEWELMGDPSRLENAVAFTRSSVSIPLYPALTDDQVDRICAALERGP